jgi:hypothetical protein
MHQHLGAGMGLDQQFELERLELVMHDAGAVPAQHVGAGLAPDVVAQVPVGCPQDLAALRVQGAHHVERTAGGDQPVGTRLHGSAGVRVDHHGTVRVLVAEGAEGIGRTAQVQRAGGVQVGHQHALLGRENLRGLAHEAHAGDDQGLRRMIAAEARHFERVADDAAGLLGEVLQVGMHVVMRDHHRIALAQQAADA